MPKGHSGINKHGAKKTNELQPQAKKESEVKAEVKTGAKATDLTRSIESINVTFDTSSPKALEELEVMAKRGEIPEDITGDRASRARFFEEFDRLYDIPPRELGKYKVEPLMGSEYRITFEHEFFRGGVEPQVVTGNRISKVSPAELSGATKYAIYRGRPRLEQALMYRADGWPTHEMRRKYGAKHSRVFSDSEKMSIVREIQSYVESQTGMKLSSRGQAMAEGYWGKVPGGWERQG